ncbi:uncharacterized protein SCHCODRAFT_02664117 [Schizophyllum commune H4-8]|uniref:uncharacterized protein n=1 Tax=Schizophyllum commune (strain H4-8 / FGSC 9210) TaxID=578458 RepID=UPI00215E751C|nr:uncharacterized protein SCHCODRAFT_02664117 [Schizophyllum commune H4-8]KAI5896289.1 hypothetical protein SCHCODRAFT_02664117 [Schizophyllum commune H4-8]
MHPRIEEPSEPSILVAERRIYLHVARFKRAARSIGGPDASTVDTAQQGSTGRVTGSPRGKDLRNSWGN